MIGSSLPYIGPDNQKGERDAVEHLLKLGHRRIAFIGGDANMSDQRERVSGWRDALNGWGLAADESRSFEVPPTRDGGRLAIDRALDSQHPPMLPRSPVTTTSSRWAQRVPSLCAEL